MELLYKFLLQDKPIARKFHATTGPQWILLCPPHLQDHCATSVHAIQACAGRNAVRKTIRGHNIANVPDSVVDPILQSCPTCLVTKNPPPVRECTAIRPKQSEDRIQAWDVTTLGEGTDAAIHTVDKPGGFNEVYAIDTEKLFVVAAAMVKSWMAYEPPTTVRCDNGPAFIGELLQIIRDVFNVKVEFIQSRQAHQNGQCERAHRPVLQKAASIGARFPHLTNFECMDMACAVYNKEYTRTLGMSPWEYRYGRKTTSQIGTHVPAESATRAASNTNKKVPHKVSLDDLVTCSTAIRQEAQAHYSRYQDTYDGKSTVRDTHVRIGDLGTVRIPPATRATTTSSKLLGFTKKGPFLCIGFAGKCLRLQDVIWKTPMPKPVSRSQCIVFRRAGDNTLQQMESTLGRMAPVINDAYAANQKKLDLLKERLKDRPDAPICTSCKKPTHKWHALRMCQPCYQKHAYHRKKGNAPA
ncbi:hypothetical protein CYMTET_18765 [Cymbomonas tetramitiformis]|uniref:Integrase catalytic domain-containing protein n=1 Tax=Cymbomonas tetramitiformis TaxID=36881 RepID=A0AAE0L5X9_9CHLO|nr:hypothetical protein CYMTET_18765 [Cymbomonas tetramitiformis]